MILKIQTAVRRTLCFTFLALLLVGCTSVPIAQKTSPVAPVFSSEDPTGLLSSKAHILPDPFIEKYFLSLAQKLGSGPIGGIRLIEPIENRWWSFALRSKIPLKSDLVLGININLIKGLQFENEWAALLAVLLAQSQMGEAINGLPSEEACERAVNLLYDAGFDPRGLVSIWQVHEMHGVRSPFDDREIAQQLEMSRRKIALKAPLRNPIIRTPEFYRVQIQVQKL